MFVKILIGLALLLALFVIVAALQPAAFRIARSTTIAAPAAVAFAQVNDLLAWQEVSPWAKLDPNVKNTFEGPRAGPGAVFTWSGNSKVGAGRMTLTESRPDEFVRFRLEFFQPFASTNLVDFTFTPEAGQTKVTWSMTGENNFVAKAFGLVVNVDKMVGADFEKGLANLKALAEAAAQKK
jgi:hypothetical protein